jgi:hypothetical protein
MKKFWLGIPIIVAGLFTLATGVWAETGNIVANIDHDFVASGQAHPAGKYRVYRLSPEELILRSEETGASVFLIPSMHDETLAWQQPEVKLRLAGDVYYLSEVVTGLGVYKLPAPQVLTRKAKAKDHTAAPAPGSN